MLSVFYTQYCSEYMQNVSDIFLKYSIKIEIITIPSSPAQVCKFVMQFNLIINEIYCYFSSLKVTHDIVFFGDGLLFIFTI